MWTRSLGMLFVLAALASCNKGTTIEQLRTDGFQCLSKGGGVGGAPKLLFRQA